MSIPSMYPDELLELRDRLGYASGAKPSEAVAKLAMETYWPHRWCSLHHYGPTMRVLMLFAREIDRPTKPCTTGITNGRVYKDVPEPSWDAVVRAYEDVDNPRD
jgi:hypothetical protein